MNQKNPKKWNVHNSPMDFNRFQRLVDQGRWFCKHYRSVEEEYQVYVNMFWKRHNGNYVCEDCGVEDPRVQIHHIKPQKYHPELSSDQDNMKVVCKRCHKKYHRR